MRILQAIFKEIFILQNSRLIDENLLVLKDADAVSSNQYSVHLLDDTSNALNMIYNILPIEHHLRPNQAPSTGIFPSEYRVIVFISHFISFDKCLRVSFALIIRNSSHVFSRDLHQEDPAAEITVSRNSSSHG